MCSQTEFDRPPVVEMAIGVQFQPILGLRGVDLGPLRELWRADYPSVQEQPVLPPAVEAPPIAGLGLRLGFGAVPAVRHWFVSPEGDLLQVQTDRFVVNWRRGGSGRPYPRYSHVREEFRSRFDQFREFITAEMGGQLSITQAELNYINQLGDAVADGGPLHGVLRPWGEAADHHLGDPEQAQLMLSFLIPEVGRPPARLHLALGPGLTDDGREHRFLGLTGRGAPAGDQLADALKFLDEIHDHLNRSFRELTSDTIQTSWGAQR